MGFLKDAFERMPRPIIEGRGIKVFRFNELTSTSRFKDFAIMESWGWEDVWDDMLDDLSVQGLVQDISELIVKGTSLESIADNLEELEDRAATHLSTEERTVLLKWFKKMEEQIKRGPPREEENEEEDYSDTQLDKLRKEYSRVTTIEPTNATYKALITHLDSIPQHLLKSLAAAKIKFVSPLARNRVK